MSDFRMDKKKPIGSRNLNSIMGWNVKRKTKPNQVSATPSPVATDDAALPVEALRPFEIVEPWVGLDLSPEEALGQVVTLVDTEEEVEDDPDRDDSSDRDVSAPAEDGDGSDSEVDEPADSDESPADTVVDDDDTSVDNDEAEEEEDEDSDEEE